MNEPIRTERQSDFSDAKRTSMLRQVSEHALSKVGLFTRCYDGSASPRQAIKAHCLECCWMDEAAIRECRSMACPLWEFRPYQKRG
jgi:hypothetical protein